MFKFSYILLNDVPSSSLFRKETTHVYLISLLHAIRMHLRANRSYT